MSSSNGLGSEAMLFGGLDKTEEEDLTLPRASLNKLIKETLPDLRVSNEVRELILQCCTEFIHLLSSEANEVCKSQQKKTMSSEHVLLGRCFVPYFCHYSYFKSLKLCLVYLFTTYF